MMKRYNTITDGLPKGFTIRQTDYNRVFALFVNDVMIAEGVRYNEIENENSIWEWYVTQYITSNNLLVDTIMHDFREYQETQRRIAYDKHIEEIKRKQEEAKIKANKALEEWQGNQFS